jgi:hypothetical protein
MLCAARLLSDSLLFAGMVKTNAARNADKRRGAGNFNWGAPGDELIIDALDIHDPAYDSAGKCATETAMNPDIAPTWRYVRAPRCAQETSLFLVFSCVGGLRFCVVLGSSVSARPWPRTPFPRTIACPASNAITASKVPPRGRSSRILDATAVLLVHFM